MIKNYASLLCALSLSFINAVVPIAFAAEEDVSEKAAQTESAVNFKNIVAYGDSIAVGMSYREYGAHDVGKSAVGGIGLHGEFSQLQKLARSTKKDDLVLVSVGTNDATALMRGWISKEEYLRRLETVIDLIKERGGKAVIYGTSTHDYTRGSAAWEKHLNGDFDNILEKFAGQNNLPYVDTGAVRGKTNANGYTASDGLHYTRKGYAALVKAGVKSYQIFYKKAAPRIAPVP